MLGVNCLEAEADLRLDHPAAEGAGPLSERAVRRGRSLRGRYAACRRCDNNRADILGAEWNEVELIEQIVEIDAEIKFRVLAQNRQGRQSESFAEGCVDRRVARSAEGIARHARFGRDADSRAKVWRGEIGERAVGKVGAARFKPSVAEIGTRTADVRGWPNRAIVAIHVDQATSVWRALYLDVIERSKWEASVGVEDAGYRPTPRRLHARLSP